MAEENKWKQPGEEEDEEEEIDETVRTFMARSMPDLI